MSPMLVPRPHDHNGRSLQAYDVSDRPTVSRTFDPAPRFGERAQSRWKTAAWLRWELRLGGIMDIPIWLLIGLAAGVLAFVGRMAWYRLKGKDPSGRERHHR
jgi:hypothetical protein